MSDTPLDRLTEFGWSTDLAEMAEREGWNIWLANGEEAEIERDDHEDTPFGTDDDAILYVVELARRGSELHRCALHIHVHGTDAEGG